jgi:hypothetical protein
MNTIKIKDTYGLVDYCIEMGYPFEYADGNNGYDIDELYIDVPFEPTPDNIFQFAIDYSRWFFTNDLSSSAN